MGQQPRPLGGLKYIVYTEPKLEVATFQTIFSD